MSRSGADGQEPRWTWLVPATALLVVCWALWADPLVLRILRNATFDQFQRWQPRDFQDAPVRIVDIDDESMRRLGQWPWSRTRVAELVGELSRAQAASVALDIVFAEPDRTSPKAVLQDQAVPAAMSRYLETLPDHDQQLADVLADSRVVLGFALTKQAPADPVDALEPPPGGPSTAGMVMLGESPLPYLPAFGGSVPSLSVLQRAAAGHGALTFVPDADGVVRRVPLLASLAGDVVPSLAAEALRVAQGARNYTLRTAPNGGGLVDVSVGRLRIPTNAEGAVWVHYGRPRAERYVPAWKVLAHAVPASEFAGKIVLVGTSAQGLMDLRFSPLGGIIPGVEVHAQALEQVLTGQHLARPGWAPGVELLLTLVGGLVVGGVAVRSGAVASVACFLALSALLCLVAWQAYAQFRSLLDPAGIALAWLLVFLPTTVIRHVASDRRQRWVRQAFARYVSPNLVDYLIAHPKALALGGKRQRCSFVFADLAGYTTIMETMDPAEAVRILNAYLDKMIAIAFEHEGTLDRIVGDSIAIVFSTPVEQADHEARALRCALAMQRFARRFVDDLAAAGTPFCETRIGVHTGEVTVGNFGGSTIFDYRALGDPVNTASRLEGANKYLGTLICVSQATLAACPGAPARPIGRLQLAGRAEPVMAWEPLDAQAGCAATDDDYGAAYQAMADGRAEALAAFERLATERPADPLVRLHRDRLRAGDTGERVVLGGK